MLGNSKENTRVYAITWLLRNILLKNQWVMEKFWGDIKKELNKNEKNCQVVGYSTSSSKGKVYKYQYLH